MEYKSIVNRSPGLPAQSHLTLPRLSQPPGLAHAEVAPGGELRIGYGVNSVHRISSGHGRFSHAGEGGRTVTCSTGPGGFLIRLSERLTNRPLGGPAHCGTPEASPRVMRGG